MGQTIQGLLTRCVHGEGVDLPENCEMYIDRKEDRKKKIAALLQQSKVSSQKQTPNLSCYTGRDKRGDYPNN